MKYCPHCGAEYREEIDRCAHCPDALLVSEPPAPAAWSASRAGWEVVVAGEEAAALEPASKRLEDAGIEHMILQRSTPSGAYLPVGEGGERARPLTFEAWGEAHLLVVARPRHEAAISVVKGLDPGGGLERGPAGLPAGEARPAQRQEPSYRLPWEEAKPPLSRERKAFGVLIAAFIGFGVGLFWIRRYGWALLCFLLQASILLPVFFGVPPEPEYSLPHVVGRALEFIVAIQTFFRKEGDEDEVRQA